MKHCLACGITVQTTAVACPLCHTPLAGDASATQQTYPTFQPKKVHRLLLEGGIAFFLITLHVVLNLFILPNLLWCIPLCATVLYSWMLLILRRKGKLRRGITWKYHLLPVTVLLILYNLYMNEAGPVLSWYPTYGLAFCIALCLLINHGWMFFSRRSALDIIPSQLIISLLGMVPIYLVLVRVITFSWASVGTAALSVITLVSLLVLYRANIRAMLKHYFYVLS